jgi:hypothetical protein
MTKPAIRKATLAKLLWSKKGEPTTPPTTYPTVFQLVCDCLMEPSLDHQYQVEDFLLDNVVVILLQNF